MESLFIRKPLDETETQGDLEMQILSWRGYDNNEHYTITFCGVSNNGNSIGVTVRDFKPFFYLKMPDSVSRSWNKAVYKTDYKTKQSSAWSKIDLFQEFCQYYIDNLEADEGLGECHVVVGDRKILYPFTDGKKFRFLKITLDTEEAKKRLYYKLKRQLTIPGVCNKDFFKPYEANLDPMLRFGHIREIPMAGWITIPKSCYTITQFYTRCQINLLINDSKQIIPMDKMDVSRLVIASFDIECDSCATRENNAHLYPEHKSKCRPVFPDFNNPKDQVKIICTTFKAANSDDIFKHAIVSGQTDEVPEADLLIRCDNEKELFSAWLDMIKKYDPDILIGYNIFGFDDRYMWYRMIKYKMRPAIDSISRLKNVNCSIMEKELVSSAYGTNFFEIFDIPGVYKIDLYVWMKKEEKLESYKLDNVAHHFLGLNKVDLPPLDLFYHMNGTPKQMQECITYCVQDTVLPIKLLEYRKILINLIQMATITRVPIDWLIIRGQQIKVFSQLCYECRKEGVLVPTNDSKKKEQEKFAGATVLKPKKGYYQDGVSGLDFASLYPSIMIADKLCYSTYIPQDDLHRYKSRTDLKIMNIAWSEQYDEDDPDKNLQSYSFNFVQNKDSILPRILTKLWTSRKVAKKEMKAAKQAGDTNLADVLNGKQLAIKVTMNSVYGFTGATNGFMPMKIIASCVTARGRQLIDQTKSFCESHYDCEVIYGDTDSCYVKFNGLDRNDPNYMKDLFDLSIKAADAVTAEFKKPIELEFEKVMMPLLLFNKKRYACKMWTNPDKPDYVDCKGIQIVRRDNCEYVREVSKKILDKIMYDNDIDAALQEASDSIVALLYDRVDSKKLLLSKTLRTGYKCSRCKEYDKTCKCEEGPKVNLPHFQLVKKMKIRNAIDIPQSGDRVPFFYISGGGLSSSRIEHPLYLNKINPEGQLCTPDVLYYLDRQLRQPIITLLELVMDDTSTLFENGPYGEEIIELRDAQKEIEKKYRLDVKRCPLMWNVFKRYFSAKGLAFKKIKIYNPEN